MVTILGNTGAKLLSMDNWVDAAYSEYLNDTELYFEHVGSKNAPAIVYIHGGPGYNSYSFRSLMEDDLDGYQMVYLDQRGSGRSAELNSELLRIDTLVDDLEAVREFLNIESWTVMGHGFGAMVALEYARRFPEYTDRSILVSPWVHMPALALHILVAAARFSQVPLVDPKAQVLADTPEGEVPAVGQARVAAAFALLNARDLLNRMQFNNLIYRMRLEFADAESQLVGGAEVQQALVDAGLWEFEYVSYLPEQVRPIYVIGGLEDQSCYPHQVEWFQELENAHIATLSSGHYPWIDDAEGFCELLEEAMQDTED